MIIEGALSVKAALKYENRDIHHVYLPSKKHTKDIQYIRHLCYKNNIEFSLISKEEANEMAVGHTHGGVLAKVGYRTYQEDIAPSNDIMLVEGIEDPYNLGMVIRTATAAGFSTVITNYREYNDNEAIILKASAGTSESIHWIAVNSFDDILFKLKQGNIPIYCALRSKSSMEYDQVKYPNRICLCIGGEKRGLSRPVIEASDVFIHVVYDNTVKVALTAVSASAVLAFEIVRQRKSANI